MPRDRRATIALVLVLIVSVAVVAAVLLVGVQRVPDYPSVADRRDPAVHGTIAYLKPPADGSRGCVYVVAAAGGASRQVYCPAGNEEPAALLWQDDGTLVLGLYGPFAAGTAVRIDPRTGRNETIELDWEKALPYPPGEVSEPRESDGARLATDGWDETDTHAWLDVSIGSDRRRLVSASGPRGYSFHDPQWSPDGRWVLFQDSEERLLIVREDDPANVRVVTRRTWSVAITGLDVEPAPGAGS